MFQSGFPLKPRSWLNDRYISIMAVHGPVDTIPLVPLLPLLLYNIAESREECRCILQLTCGLRQSRVAIRVVTFDKIKKMSFSHSIANPVTGNSVLVVDLLNLQLPNKCSVNVELLRDEHFLKMNSAIEMTGTQKFKGFVMVLWRHETKQTFHQTLE